MNKTAIKNFAIWARVSLIESAKQRAFEYEITKEGPNSISVDVIDGRILSKEEKDQRSQLIKEIDEKGFDQVMEEAAYTWFNRFIALRYMEVNGYLPSKVRVFSNEAGEFKPAILDEAMTVEIDGLDREHVLELLDRQDNETLYKVLLIAQCNSLSAGLPYMFEKISNWTELLFPKNLLKSESVIGQMVASLPESDWEDAVQIIGWLYQYYNTELKDETFALLKKNIKITKERIPAATQLFTPEWIVKYLVENSLGYLWIENHPSSSLIESWEYFHERPEQSGSVTLELKSMKDNCHSVNPDQIRVIDPCMGSGHILVYAFDVLMQMYVESGWAERDAAISIIENNIYGLDIDDRAGQLAYFAVMMKARKYNRRVLTSNVMPHIMSVQDSSFMSEDYINFVSGGSKEINRSLLELKRIFRDAKDLGSVVEVSEISTNILEQRIDEIKNLVPEDIFSIIYKQDTIERLSLLVNQAKYLQGKYDVVVTNPPYMGGSGMNAKLAAYINDKFEDSKSDLFAVFIERCSHMLKKGGYQAMITQHAWMFLASYNNLRIKMSEMETVCMAHLGAHAFEEIGGEVVQTTAFVRGNFKIKGYLGTYARLVNADSQDGKEEMYLSRGNRFISTQDDFTLIPGAPIAYWASDTIRRAFESSSLYEYSISPSQNITGNNGRFVRKHWEIPKAFIGDRDSWIFYAKGGGYRKWWGNLDDVVEWTPEARKIYQFGDGKHASQIINKEYWYRKGITWNLITSNTPSFRVMPDGATFDKGGSTIIVNDDVYKFVLGLLNSKVYLTIVEMLNPTLNFQVKDVRSMPLILESVDEISLLVDTAIDISKSDWNSFENSWEYKRNPLIPDTISEKNEILISDCFSRWADICKGRFSRLKATEEKLNEIFIDIYGLNQELNSEISEMEVSINLADEVRDIKHLISYAVGCMFGRYSLTEDGVVYAGGVWDASHYGCFMPDDDGIIPICDDEYFNDDIVTKFESFIKIVYGEKMLEDNLKYIAGLLGGKGQPREVIRNYFINNFYKDHCSLFSGTAGKRPIYWLFDSGKKNGFKCLIYIQRYQPDYVARIRTDYIFEQQSRYHTVIEEIEARIEMATGPDRVKLSKVLGKIKDQELELRGYEEKIHHYADQMIELDLLNGVKNNYAVFEEILAKI